MFESYPDVQYDEKTRRINRWMKVIGVPVAILLFASLIAAIVAAVEGLSTDAEVLNDTSGEVVCYARFTSPSDEVTVRATGRLAPGARDDITVNSRCAVFSSSGDYVGCFGVSDSGRQILASSNNPRVKAEACVYPR